MPTHDVVFTAAAFAELARRLSAGWERVRFGCGVSRLADRREWLVARTDGVPADAPAVLAVRGTHPEVLSDAVRVAAAGETDGTRVVLAVGVGPAAGHVAGLVRHDRLVAPLGSVRVIGAGLPRLALGSAPVARPPAHRLRFARTIGALGDGAFDQLRSLRLAVVGCGRIGSLAAELAAAYGVAALTLIDADVMEPHNLGEMVGGLDAAVGWPKAAAVAGRVARAGWPTAVTALTAAVQSFDALFALKASDVIVSCPDNAAARLATASVAALYLKPVLDIGTGVVRGPTGREIGLDVRWLLPGRCVSCVGSGGGANPPRLGSLRSLAGADPAVFFDIDDRTLVGDPKLSNLNAGPPRTTMPSPRSLNTWAVGLGFTLLEQFVSGALRDSVWVQGEVGPDGVPRWASPQLPAGGFCRVCARGGRGDAGLPSVTRPAGGG